MYSQIEKNKSRREVLRYSIELLTKSRGQSSILNRDYVRNIADYLNYSVQSYNNGSITNEDYKVICDWENYHDQVVGSKSPDQLKVCYLSGPEPQNDFDELLRLGVNPNNIWAFEKDKNTFEDAIKELKFGYREVPKLMNRSIEEFLVNTPMVFDIVYIDACGSAFPSSKHTMRIISTLLKHHRLSALGVIISNFSEPQVIEQNYIEYIANYIVGRNDKLSNYKNMCYVDLLKEIEDNFSSYYGNYITRCLMDLSSFIVPTMRFCNSNYWNIITDSSPKDIVKGSNGKFSFNNTNTILNSYELSKKYKAHGLWQKQLNELSGINPLKISIIDSLKYYNLVKQDRSFLKQNICDMYSDIEQKRILISYLDKIDPDVFTDIVFNQLSYPMHYNVNVSKRFSYIAKTNKMHLDISVLDSCRYVYEWIPTIYFIQKALSNNSWQKTIRFSLDGLSKNRMEYDDGYFYKSSVVSKNLEGFESKEVVDRIEL